MQPFLFQIGACASRMMRGNHVGRLRASDEGNPVYRRLDGFAFRVNARVK
jgi:hypothetical protein